MVASQALAHLCTTDTWHLQGNGKRTQNHCSLGVSLRCTALLCSSLYALTRATGMLHVVRGPLGEWLMRSKPWALVALWRQVATTTCRYTNCFIMPSPFCWHIAPCVQTVETGAGSERFEPNHTTPRAVFRQILSLERLQVDRSHLSMTRPATAHNLSEGRAEAALTEHHLAVYACAASPR